jgi:hypothetical protein
MAKAWLKGNSFQKRKNPERQQLARNRSDGSLSCIIEKENENGAL